MKTEKEIIIEIEKACKENIFSYDLDSGNIFFVLPSKIVALNCYEVLEYLIKFSTFEFIVSYINLIICLKVNLKLDDFFRSLEK